MRYLSTLSNNGRITVQEVDDEIARLKSAWSTGSVKTPLLSSIMEYDEIEKIDLFDQYQLETVVRVCQESKSLSEAGRKLFSVSRQAKKQTNDADRLRKYLAKFGLSWSRLSSE